MKSKRKQPKTPTTTVAEINRANREYWDRRNGTLKDLIAKYQPETPEGVLAILEGEEAIARSDESFARVESQANTSRARKKRPKKKPTYKTEFIAAMTQWRKDDGLLKDFIDAAENGSIEGLSITSDTAKGSGRYVISSGEVVGKLDLPDGSTGKKVAYSTIAGWWDEAKPA